MKSWERFSVMKNGFELSRTPNGPHHFFLHEAKAQMTQALHAGVLDENSGFQSLSLDRCLLGSLRTRERRLFFRFDIAS